MIANNSSVNWIEDFEKTGELPRASVFASANHFHRLQLPVSFELDEGQLDSQFLKFSSIVHPDRHVRKSPREQMKAVALSAAVNESVRVLRNPVERAELVLTELGGQSAEDDKSLPAGFLIEMMEIREELEDALRANNAEKIAEILKSTSAQRDELIDWLTAAFKAPEELDSNKLREIRSRLNTFRYLDNIIGQCQKD